MDPLDRFQAGFVQLGVQIIRINWDVRLLEHGTRYVQRIVHGPIVKAVQTLSILVISSQRLLLR